MIRRLLKERLILLFGISLPILLVMVFYLAAALPKALVKPPEYDLIYLTTPYPHDGISTDIKEGKLKIWVTPKVRKGALPMPRLFLFSAKTQSSKEIPISLSTNPGITAPNKKEELQIPEIKNLKIDPNNAAPDGYQAEITSPNMGGIVNVLLVNTRRALVISKNGSVINISDENNGDGNKSIKFIGWVKP